MALEIERCFLVNREAAHRAITFGIVDGKVKKLKKIRQGYLTPAKSSVVGQKTP